MGVIFSSLVSAIFKAKLTLTVDCTPGFKVGLSKVLLLLLVLV